MGPEHFNACARSIIHMMEYPEAYYLRNIFGIKRTRERRSRLVAAVAPVVSDWQEFNYVSFCRYYDDRHVPSLPPRPLAFKKPGVILDAAGLFKNLECISYNTGVDYTGMSARMGASLSLLRDLQRQLAGVLVRRSPEYLSAPWTS